jgi:hypothetical protein
MSELGSCTAPCDGAGHADLARRRPRGAQRLRCTR